MIPLIKEDCIKNQYNKWLSENKDELEKHFNKYLDKEAKSWINDKNIKIIQNILFKTSNNKCAYCEKTEIDIGYLEIDHFYPKYEESFKNLIFDFDNLLPCCHICNTNKKTKYKDKNNIEMINPYKKQTLKNDFELNLENLWISGLSDEGKATIDILNKSINTDSTISELNIDSPQLLSIHCTDFEKNILEKLQNYEDKVIFRKNYQKNSGDNYILKENITDEDKNKIVELLNDVKFYNKIAKGAIYKRKEIKNSLFKTLNAIKELFKELPITHIIKMIRNLLNKIQTNQSCTATYATIILNNQIFKEIMSLIKNKSPNDYEELKKIIDEKEYFCLKSG